MDARRIARVGEKADLLIAMGDYSKCIREIGSVPEDERGYRLTLLLGWAYSNLAVLGDHNENENTEDADQEMLSKAVDILMTIEERGRDDPVWNSRMCYALWMINGRESDALRYADRWMELDPKSDDARNQNRTIREFLEGQCIANTLSQLRREQALLEEKLQEMQRRKSLIEKRIAGLEEAEKIEAGKITLRELPERRCVRLEQYITKDEEMDFVIKKLHRQHEDRIQDLGTQTIGAFFAENVMREGVPNTYDSVFFVLEDGAGESDFALPAGRYASCFYRGGYGQNADQVRRMLDDLREKGLSASGGAFELYRIDNRDTIREEEFLTEIQIPVKAGEGKSKEQSSHG